MVFPEGVGVGSGEAITPHILLEECSGLWRDIRREDSKCKSPVGVVIEFLECSGDLNEEGIRIIGQAWEGRGRPDPERGNKATFA